MPSGQEVKNRIGTGAAKACMCRARLLSDLTGQTACSNEATSPDGRLCAFHSRQCQGQSSCIIHREILYSPTCNSPLPRLQEAQRRA